MTLKQPQSMEELVYYTDRQIGTGSVRCWVFREKCPKCGKSLMGKPRDNSGKVMIRAKEYVCQSCGFKMEKNAYEDTLTANIEYTCPSCGYKGEIQVPFKRKNVNGVQTLRFKCQKCNATIDITKKMKEIKKGKGKLPIEGLDE
ncbi:MAG: hypothetical protein QXW00_04285 [Candidatus Woesearchaeota archaeon]